MRPSIPTAWNSSVSRPLLGMTTSIVTNALIDTIKGAGFNTGHAKLYDLANKSVEIPNSLAPRVQVADFERYLRCSASGKLRRRQSRSARDGSIR